MTTLIKDIYKTVGAQIPEGMDGNQMGKTILHTEPNAQGDIKMYTTGVAQQVGLSFASGKGNPINKSLTVIEGEHTRNDHVIVLDIGAECFWNPEPNTRTDLELGVLEVTSGQAFLYHTAEHEPFTITPTDGRILFTRTREMGEEIRKIAD